MFGGFLQANGSPAAGKIRFWWMIAWVNGLNALLVGTFAFAAAVGVLLAWRWLG